MFESFDRWGWFLIGAVLTGLEMLAPGVFLFWLGLAAFLVGFLHVVLLALGLSLSPAAHLVAFALASAVMVLIGRRLSRARSSAALPESRAERLVGMVFPLQTAIKDGTGTIRVDDTIWRVGGPNLPAGTSVRVIGVEGALLLVRMA